MQAGHGGVDVRVHVSAARRVVLSAAAELVLSACSGGDEREEAYAEVRKRGSA